MSGNVSFIDGHIDEVKQTNYDRIKKMSVEEMADILRDIYTQGYIDCLHDEGNVSVKEIEQWLLQEVADNDNT